MPAICTHLSNEIHFDVTLSNIPRHFVVICQISLYFWIISENKSGQFQGIFFGNFFLFQYFFCVWIRSVLAQKTEFSIIMHHRNIWPPLENLWKSVNLAYFSKNGHPEISNVPPNVQILKLRLHFFASPPEFVQFTSVLNTMHENQK